MTDRPHKPDKERDLNHKHGRKGANGDWPGCTQEFVNKTEQRRKKNKEARKARKKNRKK